MDDVKQLWASWQSLLVSYGTVFTRPGWVRFVQWVTGTILCQEEHTITQILEGVGLEGRWRNVEAFAEYGAWDRAAVEQATIRLIEAEQPMAQWGRYRVVAWDDTKEHRTSAKVWGTCTLHESTARSSNRAETVRVHNWGGRFASRLALAFSASFGAALLPRQATAEGREVSQENAPGRGLVSARERGVSSAAGGSF